MIADVGLSASPYKPRSRPVVRDSAEDLSYTQVQTPKPLEDLAPQAGTVGIELVDQSFIGQVTNEHNEAMLEMLENSPQQPDQQVAKEQDNNELLTANTDSAESTTPELSTAVQPERTEINNADAQQQRGDNVMHQRKDSAEQELAVLTAGVEKQQDDEQGPAKQASAAAQEVDRVWYKERPVQLTIFGYTLIAFLYNCSDELIPLFAAAPPSIGGVGLLANQLAVPLVLSGVVLMWYAVYGYPWFQRTYGAIVSCRIGLVATAPCILLIPVAHYFSASVVASQVVLCIVLACKAMAATNSFSASMILVNNAAPMHALGKVNGTGQMLASFVRAVGPALAGVVWGSTASLGLAGSQFISFAFVAAIACLTQFVYVFLKMPTPDR